MNCAFLAGGSSLGACPGLFACRGCGSEGKWWGLLPSQEGSSCLPRPGGGETGSHKRGDSYSRGTTPHPARTEPRDSSPPPTAGSPILQPGTVVQGLAELSGWSGEYHQLQE